MHAVSAHMWLCRAQKVGAAGQERGVARGRESARYAAKSTHSVWTSVVPTYAGLFSRARRVAGDYENNDDIYEAIDNFDANPHAKPKLEVARARAHTDARTRSTNPWRVNLVWAVSNID